MHEALFDPGMQTRPTAHPEVLEVVGQDELGGDVLERLIDELGQAARRGDRVSIDALLREAVPGFHPAERLWDIRV